MKSNRIYLKKQILYRCTHTGTKESDIIYKDSIVNNINQFNESELLLILEMLEQNSDIDLVHILRFGLVKNNIKYEKILKKIRNTNNC